MKKKKSKYFTNVFRHLSVGVGIDLAAQFSSREVFGTKFVEGAVPPFEEVELNYQPQCSK